MNRPPITVSNPFECLYIPERHIYDRDEMLALRKNVPATDAKMKAYIESIIFSAPAPQASQPKKHWHRRKHHAPPAQQKAAQAAQQRFNQPKPDPYRHFHTRKNGNHKY